MKKWVIRLTGIACLLLFFGYVYVYETYLYGKLNHTDVVVAADALPVHTIIIEDDLTTVPFPKSLLTQDMIADKHDLIGLRTSQQIAKHETFSLEKTEPAIMRQSDEHRYFSIPQSWIQSVPGSIRRLDQVDIWLSPPRSQQNHEEDGVPSYPHRNIHAPFLEDIVVAFVKNSRNTEVVGAPDPGDRLDAESMPSVLELSLTNDEFRELLNAYKDGYTFIFSY